MTKKHNYYCLISVIGIYISVCLCFFITRPLSIMEGEEFRALAAVDQVYRLLFNEMNIAWFHQPVNTIILKLIYYDSGLSVLSLRFFYLVLAVISIVYMYKIMILFNENHISTVLTLLYSLNPLVLFYGTSIQAYIIVTLFFLIHLYYLLVYHNKQNDKFLVASLIFLNIAFFSHMTAVFYGVILALFFAINYRLKSRQVFMLSLSYIPITVYFLILFIHFNQLSALDQTGKYLYYKSTELFFFLTKSISFAYSSPHWLIPVIVIILSSFLALKSKHKYSKVILFLNLLPIVCISAPFIGMYFNEIGYFYIRPLMISVPIFFINLIFILNFIDKNKIQAGCLLILSMAMLITSYDIYKKNKPVDYAALDIHLSSIIDDRDSFFFVPEFIQLPFDYEVLNINLNNISYNKMFVHDVDYHAKRIFLISMPHPDDSDRKVESYFFSKRFIEIIYHYHCILKLKKIWIIFPKERLFGIYHINYDLIQFYLSEISDRDNNIYIIPIALTDTYDIFKLRIDQEFCY